MIDKILFEIDKAINSIAPEIINKIIDPEVSAKIDKIKIPENDPFGIDKNVIKFASLVTNFMYKYWHRVNIFGIDNIPNQGAAIIVPNHGGILPLDAAYIASSIIIEHEQPRLVRTLVERFLPTVPFFILLFPELVKLLALMKMLKLFLMRVNYYRYFLKEQQELPKIILNTISLKILM